MSAKFGRDDSRSSKEAMVDNEGKATTEMFEHLHQANAATIEQAMAAEVQERMSALEAVKAYPKATFWSICVSLLIVMEAYDNALIANLMAQPAFAKHYGEPLPAGGYAVTAPWQSALNQGATIGAFFGILLCGYVQPKIGYRKSILASLVVMTCVIFVTFFAKDVRMLFAGEILSGLPYGFINAIAQSYASELAPVPLRGILTMANQFMWCSGQFITFGILYSFSDGTNNWAFRIPFAVQWCFIPLLFGLLIFAPESPYFLIRTGKLDEAHAVVQRLEGRGGREPADVVAMMQRTIEIENKQVEGASYRALFQGVELRRTMIACVIFFCQPITGLYLVNNAVYFFTVAGADAHTSFGLGLGVNGIQWVGVLIAFYTSVHYGRRQIYLFGCAAEAVLCLIIAIIATASKSSSAFWAQSAIILVMGLIYGFAIGPLTFTIVAEASSIKLRNQTCALARGMNYLSQVAFGYIAAYALNPTAWNLAGQSGFLWGGLAAVVFVFAFLAVPETKDRSPRELNVLYDRKIAARHFASTVVGAADDE